MNMRQNRMGDWLDKAVRHSGSEWFFVLDPRGYAGVIVEPWSGGIRAFWKGNPPRRIANRIRSAPAEVTVVVEPARYSRWELSRAERRLVGRTESFRPSLVAAGVWGVSIDEEGSGLTIRYQDPSNATGGPVDPGGLSARRDSLTATLTELVRVPVMLIEDAPPELC